MPITYENEPDNDPVEMGCIVIIGLIIASFIFRAMNY